jgi:hypothetical protein
MRCRSTPNVPSTTPRGKVEVEQHGTLLHVELEVGGGVAELLVRLQRAVELDAAAPERVLEPHPVLVGAVALLVRHEGAAAGARSEQATAEASPLFVRPVHEPDGDRRPTPVFLGNPPYRLEAREEVEAAVEPAAARHAVHVPADQELALALAAQRRPDVPGRVHVRLESERVELLS